MTAIPNKSLAEAERKLTMLLMEVRGTATAERVKLYVAKMGNGKLLSEYLHDESVPVKERSMLAESLIEILLTKDYSRLPELHLARDPSASRIRGIQPTVVIQDEHEPETPPDDPAVPPDELRAMVRAEVRRELASVLESMARALREA